MLGYVVAGALIGPYGLGLVRQVEAANVVGRFGVVFLLFSIGLSLSVGRLIALRRYVFGLGMAQVGVTTLCLWGLLRLLGVSSAEALVLGGGLALSSTAVVVHVLRERREGGTPRGRVAFAVLLLQDLAAVPLLALIPLLKGPETPVLPALGLAVVRGAIGLLLILAVARLLLRPLFRAVTRGGDPELFTGIVLLLVLGAGWMTEQAGLSMALGAFLAGVLVAETEYRPQIEGDIQPFRGVLLALFFMTVGMGIDIGLLSRQPSLLATLLVSLMLVKGAVLFGVARLLGIAAGTAAALGVMLAQGGEFGLVLLALAVQSRVLDLELAQIATLVVVLTMAATPLLLSAGRRIADHLDRPASSHKVLPQDTGDLRGHVLIAGYGRVGRTLSLLLESCGIPYLALELDPELVAEARQQELPVYYGDTTRADVLRSVGLEHAAALAITVDEPDSAMRMVHVVRKIAPDLPLLARARDLTQCEMLAAAGTTAAVPEVVEGSLHLAGALLRQVGVSSGEVEQVLQEFRGRAYAKLAETCLPPSRP